MKADTRNRTVFLPFGISALAIVLTTLIGASILTVVVANDTNAGAATWFYPLLATIPIAASLILSGVTVFATLGLIRGWSRLQLETGIGLVLVFLALTTVFWTLSSNWLVITIFVALPEVNREAEDIFYRSWMEIEASVILVAIFVAIALSAAMMRSTTKYWISIAGVAIALAIWELGMSVPRYL